MTGQSEPVGMPGGLGAMLLLAGAFVLADAVRRARECCRRWRGRA